MKNGFLKSFSDSKNVKYSSINVAFCALIIAIVIILNAIIGVFSEKFNWQLDMTDEGIFTMSEKMEKTVGDIFKESNAKVEIIFTREHDEVKDAFALDEIKNLGGYVNATAEHLRDNFSDNIELTYKDIEKEYTFFRNNFHSYSGTSLDQNVVIVARKNDDGTYGEYRVFNYQAFYGTANNKLYAYNGELMFTSAILGLVMDENPTVYFTWQHGETSFINWNSDSVGVDYSNIADNSDINPEAKELISIFAQNGYKVKPIDLAVEDIPADARTIVINKPQNDFSEAETEKLLAYYKASGTIFCFTEYNIELPTLYEFAEANFGVTVEPATSPVIDPSTVLANSTPSTLRAYVPDNTAALNYFKSLSEVFSAKAIIKNANVVKINSFYIGDEGYGEKDFTKYVKPILVTGDKAEFNGEKGVQNLITVTAAEKISGDISTGVSRGSYSYFLMCPNDGFTSNESLQNGANANKDMMLALVHTLCAREDTPSLVDIDFKTFINYELDITSKQATTITILISTLVPVAAIISGTVIIRRRKLR
ncbi:MAG: Gldg family protein [Clostridia bacterium]|nr:Gldg family protein [Clostridia bacterium]